MKKCTKCGVHHSGGHQCSFAGYCDDCKQWYPESEINGHRCPATEAILRLGSIKHSDGSDVNFALNKVMAGQANANFERHFKPTLSVCNTCGEASKVNTIHHCTAGVKHDDTKVDLSLLPREFLEETAKAFMAGEKKYGRYNYTGGMDWHRIIASTLRHITAFNDGEDLDAETGCIHLGNAAAGLAMLLVYYKRGLGKDTRHKGK